MTDWGRDFLRQTALPLPSPSPQQMGFPQPPLTLEPDPSLPRLALPDPSTVDVPPLDLREAIERRRTVRVYSGQPITLAALSYLLWVTQGIREITARPATRRNVPSAGARHAFETFVLANRVEGLALGLYRYAARAHALAAVPGAPAAADLAAACLNQDQITTSAVSFFWVAVAARMTWRYGDRGYRYLFLDAGHVCQNLYLAAESLSCGVCAIGAFEDARLNALLGLDGVEQFVVYAAALGRKG